MKTAWKDAEYINAMSEINFTSGERSKKVAGVLISDDAQQNTTSTTHTHNYGHLSMTFGVPNTHSQAEFAAAGDAMLWVVSEVDASTAVTTAEVLAVCDRWICTSELNTNFFANGASLPSDGDLLKNLTITDRKATTQTYFKNATGTGTFELAESSNGKALMNMTGDTIIYRNGSTLNISTELYFVSLFMVDGKQINLLRPKDLAKLKASKPNTEKVLSLLIASEMNPEAALRMLGNSKYIMQGLEKEDKVLWTTLTNGIKDLIRYVW